MESANDESPAKLDKWAIFGWSMFDFANSSFTTVMVTAYFSIYFQSVIVPPAADGSKAHGSYLWGLATAVSQLLVILTAPIFGALADFSGSKKTFLFISYIGCSLLTMALYFAGPGTVVIGFTLFVLANIFYSSGENIVGGFLPEICPQEKMGFVSGMAWGLGYIGGIGSLIAALLILKYFGEVDGYPLIWVMIGLWFLVAGIPTFLYVKEKHKHETMPPGQNLATIGFVRLYHTYLEGLRFRQLFRFLVIFMIVSTGLTAVISFASIIADEKLGFTSTQLGIFLIVTNLVAVGGAWFWGWLQDKIGSRWAIMLSLVNWVIALGLVLCIPDGDSADVSSFSRGLFWVAGGFVGIGLGATSSSCRALVGIFSPADRSGEFFGLWGFFGKLGGILGPFLFGLFVKILDMRWAIILLGSTFVVGFVLMYFINEVEGRAAARSAPPEHA